MNQLSRVSHHQFREQVATHFENEGLAVEVRKRKAGYAIHWADDGQPLARLRPTGSGDEFEVDWWDDSHWVPVDEYGPALSLDEALRLITDDPASLFLRDVWDEESDDEADEEFERFWHPSDVVVRSLLRASAPALLRHLSWCSAFGAALGGMLGDVLWGVAASAGAGFLASTVTTVIASRPRILLPTLLLGLTTALFACVGGITGSTVHAALGAGGWPLLAGLVAGGLCNLLFFSHRFFAWSLGLLAGLHLGLWLSELWGLRADYSGVLLTVLLAALCAACCRAPVRSMRAWAGRNG